MRIGYDAKRIVSNGTGLGSYGRTLINSLAALEGDDELLLYAPDEGRKEWREQVRLREGVRFVYSDRKHGLGKSLWRSHSIVEDLRRDGEITKKEREALEQKIEQQEEKIESMEDVINAIIDVYILQEDENTPII